MAHLIDTNVLVRLANHADASHAIAARALFKLHRSGEALHLAAQVLIEFRSVATRAKAANGLGLSATEAESQAAGFEAAFSLLPDTPDVFPAWKLLVESIGVIGKQVHDARLVAVCHVHGVHNLLTFNCAHFSRMATFGLGLVIVDPARI